LREEGRLKVFDSGVLRGLFERRREELAGDWRKLQNEELLN
jgi:hypothetical protein